MQADAMAIGELPGHSAATGALAGYRARATITAFASSTIFTRAPGTEHARTPGYADACSGKITAKFAAGKSSRAKRKQCQTLTTNRL